MSFSLVLLFRLNYTYLFEFLWRMTGDTFQIKENNILEWKFAFNRVYKSKRNCWPPTAPSPLYILEKEWGETISIEKNKIFDINWNHTENDVFVSIDYYNMFAENFSSFSIDFKLSSSKVREAATGINCNASLLP